MKKLSETYKELGIDFTFPIEIKDEKGKTTYYEGSSGYWERSEFDEEGNRTYYENSDGFWARYEFDENGHPTYFENSDGTKRGSCSGKVIEVDSNNLSDK